MQDPRFTPAGRSDHSGQRVPQKPVPSKQPNRSSSSYEDPPNTFSLQEFDFSVPSNHFDTHIPLQNPLKEPLSTATFTQNATNLLQAPAKTKPKSLYGVARQSVLDSVPSSDMVFSSTESWEMMAQNVARHADSAGWFCSPNSNTAPQGHSLVCVAFRTWEDEIILEPRQVDPRLVEAIERLEEVVVLSMSSEITSCLIESISPQQKSLIVERTGARIPIVSTLQDVSSYLVHSSRACIIRQERLVLLWSDDGTAIIEIGNDVEKQLLGLLFAANLHSRMPAPRLPGTFSPMANRLRASSIGSGRSHTFASFKHTSVRGALDEKNEVIMKAVALEEGTDEEIDLEAELPPRPVARIHSIIASLAIVLVILSQAMGISQLLNEYMWDGGYLRFLLILAVPALSLFSLFFYKVIVGAFFQLLMPLGNCLKNTKYHSAIKPRVARHQNYELPHITVQMPVYKEGLRGVIVPTMISVMAAIEHYEQQGGTASVFVNDDGMQVIEPELADARKQYYKENGIGYTARLPHMKRSPNQGGTSWFRKAKVTKPDEKETAEPEVLSPQALSNKIGFQRKGKFKKASNMNYGLDFSNRVEDELHRLTKLFMTERKIADGDITVEDDDVLYEQALDNMLAADEGRTWAEGNIRIGEVILIIDCDTRVPVDCLLYGSLELHESPEVAILQHGSGVMQVVHNTFENGITYFTNLVYTAIKYGVGTGDVAPFVGHNAFLRWKAVQSIAFVDPSDGQTKWWSDAHVSEDFDISLRLQMQGWVVRLATYHDGGFKEGVSLTVYDELTRWEKYAYGCNELVFNPFYQWPYKGPVTRLFMRFLWCNMPITSKVTMTAYVFTYYAIGSGMLLATVNYILVGLFPDELDHWYLSSYGIWLSLAVVFNGLSSLAFSMLRHQFKEETFWKALLKALKWLPFMTLFFSGISINCAKALLCHAFSINIEWASTAKEPGPGGFYIGLDKMVSSFKYTWIICLLLSGVMVYFSFGAPWGWNITPGAHSTAVVAIAPLAMQVGSSFFLPLGLGMN